MAGWPPPAARSARWLDQWALALRQGAVRLVSWNGVQDLQQVPLALGLRRGLHLRQVHVVDHPPIGADAAVRGVEIIDRHLLHLGRHGIGVVGADGLHGLQVMQGGRVGAGLHHGGHGFLAFEIALRPGAGFRVAVPVEAGGEL
ncbi:hypothetical protein G6F22_017623 [Rhizopus arrhizus]|nr:hypothetical protein G6F22_017623 [Rhizopus arrhizus]